MWSHGLTRMFQFNFTDLLHSCANRCIIRAFVKAREDAAVCGRLMDHVALKNTLISIIKKKRRVNYISLFSLCIEAIINRMNHYACADNHFHLVSLLNCWVLECRIQTLQSFKYLKRKFCFLGKSLKQEGKGGLDFMMSSMAMS